MWSLMKIKGGGGGGGYNLANCPADLKMPRAVNVMADNNLDMKFGIKLLIFFF